MVLCPGLLYGIVDIFSIIVLFNFFKLANSGLVLNDFISHFEPLFYDHRYLQDQHRRARRSPMDHFFTIHFTAHNRLFRLRLKRDTSVFAPNSEFESSGNTVHYDTARVLTGYLEDDEDSSAEGVVTNSGLLDGVVRARDEEYYIEPAEKYLPPPHHFHSVIYRLSDVRFPEANFTCLSHHIHHTVQQRSLVDSPVADHTSRNHFHSLDRKSLHRRKRNPPSVEDSLRTTTAEEMQFRSLTKTNSARHSDQNFHQPGQKNSVDSENGELRQQPLERLSSDLHSVHIKQQRRFKTINFINQLDFFSKFSSTAYKSNKRFWSQWTSSKNNQASGWYRGDSSPRRGVSRKGVKHIQYGKLPFVVYGNSSASSSRDLPQRKNGVPQALRGRQPFDTTERMEVEDIVPYWRELDALHYTEDGRTGSSEPYGVRSIQRTQWTEERGQRHVAVDRRKSTCLLYLQADHLFYQRMGSEEACIEAMTRHVQRVNSIYRTTDFDQDGRPDNISFLIKRIKVHTKPDEPEYRFVGNYGVEKFLELFSEDDYDAFCLAYMFTYRDFEGGTLGLAWTGDLKNAGGVCEKNGHYRGSLKSLNTGIITLLNYGKHVPPVVSHVTLAHEIGHNFGSPHDPEDDQHCTPGGEHGNYIMFARATSGDKKNNNKFSPCSLRSINAVLNTKARSVKGCFTEPLDAVCGNEVVEGAEECDCGWEEDCHEPCCFPMRVSPPQDQPPCRLRPAAFCSPSQGPCCSHDCRLKYDVMCREDNGCRTASYCDGKGPQCPPSTKKPNKTICSEEFVCYKGECTGSICMAYGLESCQCVRNFHDPLIRSCELCCKLPGDELSCKSSFEWNLPPYDVPDLYAKPGAPCDNYNGYCDVYQTCREIDPSGPLATLRKLLLSPEGAAVLRRWLAERWWGLLLLFLAVAFTVAISVRLLSRRNAKSFLSTILPGQSDFRFCHSRSSSHSRPSHLVASASGTTNSMVKSSIASRPRISSAPENGWV